MGGNKSYKVSMVVGSSREATKQIEQVKSALVNKKAAQVALAVVAAADPTIGKVVLAGKVLHSAYKIYNDMHDSYEKNGDYQAALGAGGKKLVALGAKEAIDKGIEYMVGESYKLIKESPEVKRITMEHGEQAVREVQEINSGSIDKVVMVARESYAILQETNEISSKETTQEKMAIAGISKAISVSLENEKTKS